MLGVVCTNPVTGCVEPWTIAGPTDGSTNIVHHDENRDYQLATANDSQYGASYLGITECCKPLYNPSTGNLTVDCATTTSTGVDVNADDTVDVAHPIIAQNYDCDDAEFKNKLIKTSCFNYNPQCYVCNDPVTGNPVRKPVVHIGTLCADEYLGFNEGLPRRNNVCEDCWRCIPFIGEDNGEETLDTSSLCDTFSHNSCTCTTKMEHLEIADICKPGDGLYIGNITFNPNSFEFSTKDPTNTFDTRFAGFKAQMSGSGFHVCEVNPSTCCTNYRLSLSDSCSSIETNSLTIKPTGNASLCLSLNYIPLTADTENSNYELVGLNVSNNQLKKLDGFSYDPTTCYLCGNFCGNLNIFPYGYNWTGNTGKTCLKVDDYGFHVTNYCGANASAWLGVGNDSVYAQSICGCLSLGNDYNGVILSSCSDAFIASCNCLHLHSCDTAFINIRCNVNITAGTWGAGTADRQTGHVTICATGNSQTALIRFMTNYNGTCTCHIFENDCNLTKICAADGCSYPYALMCDLSAAQTLPVISNVADTITLASCVCGTSPQAVNTILTTAASVTVCGKTISFNYLIGTIFKDSTKGFGFTGLIADTSISPYKKYNATLWLHRLGGVMDEWSIVSPIPGTMYGTASVNGINVEGTV